MKENPRSPAVVSEPNSSSVTVDGPMMVQKVRDSTKQPEKPPHVTFASVVKRNRDISKGWNLVYTKPQGKDRAVEITTP